MTLNEKIQKYLINSSDKIKINTKDIKKNDVFIALQGTNIHGNEFIYEALNVGAKYVITDKKFSQVSFNNQILLVENTFIFIEELSIKKRSLYHGEVIGITGSAGKTSLKENLKFFLDKKFIVSASIKSYNNKLGVMISILNMNINSHFAIFEIGTNNFFEIRDLTKLVQPSQIFISNILSTHLEKFKTKNNIAKEKSDIFCKKYNPLAKTLYLQKNTKEEEILENLAKQQKLNKIISIGKNKVDCFIDNIKYIQTHYQLNIKILKKNIRINLDRYEEHKVTNLIFVLTFFIVNKISTEIIIKNLRKIPLIEGRGSIHNILFNGLNIKLIDHSYNANPETMLQSIKNFSLFNKSGSKKFLILGNMNELGLKSVNFHFRIIKEVERHAFDKVILSGNFFKKALSMFKELKNKYVYRDSSQSIMSYLNKNVHKNAIIMAKCSNKTEVNKFIKLLKNHKKG